MSEFLEIGRGGDDPGRSSDWSPPRFELDHEPVAPRTPPPRNGSPPPRDQAPAIPARRAAAGRRNVAPRRNLGTVLALAFLFGAGLGLIALSAMAMPQILGLVLVVLGLTGFAALHYVLWGWWLRTAEPAEPGDADSA